MIRYIRHIYVFFNHYKLHYDIKKKRQHDVLEFVVQIRVIAGATSDMGLCWLRSLSYSYAIMREMLGREWKRLEECCLLSHGRWRGATWPTLSKREMFLRRKKKRKKNESERKGKNDRHWESLGEMSLKQYPMIKVKSGTLDCLSA